MSNRKKTRRVAITVTLAQDVISGLEERLHESESRSRFIETVLAEKLDMPPPPPSAKPTVQAKWLGSEGVAAVQRAEAGEPTAVIAFGKVVALIVPPPDAPTEVAVPATPWPSTGPTTQVPAEVELHKRAYDEGFKQKMNADIEALADAHHDVERVPRQEDDDNVLGLE